MFMGQVKEVGRRSRELSMEARDRGDLFAVVNLFASNQMVHLAADDPDAALQDSRQLGEDWKRRGFYIQDHSLLMDEVMVLLYRGDALPAWQKMLECWSDHRSSLLFRVQQVRIFSLYYRAASALAAAAMADDPRRLVLDADRTAGRLEAERMPWSESLALLIRAGVAATLGNPDRSRSLLAEAMDALDVVSMHLWANAARRRLGRLIGGDEGRALVAQADAWMSDQGVRNPIRTTNLYAPGFRE
jgi:hypothetical protein